jgi:hypothetical protein
LKKKLYVIFLDLVAVGKSTHTAHHTENVVIYSEYLDGVVSVYTLEVEGSVVNAGHVAGAGWLMFFGLEGEGIHVNLTGGAGGGHGLSGGSTRGIYNGGAHGGYALVMLVGLHKLEILGHTLGETFMTVELELGGVIGRYVSTYSGGVVLLNPYEFLHGVVEVKLNLGGSRFITGELKLLNEVFVRHLGETATLISVKVDVINVESGGVNGGGRTGTHNGFYITEFKVNLDFMVLESNEGEGKTGVAAEPELKGHEHGLLGRGG